MLRLKLILLAAMCLLMLYGCGIRPESDTNGISTLLTGKIVQPDGITPATGVIVTLRPQGSLADIPQRIAKVKNSDETTVTTDKSGTYQFNTIPDSGLYVIEAHQDSNKARIDSVALIGNTHGLTIPVGTLLPTGAISGRIQLPPDNTSEVYILAFGVNRFVKVAADGSFCFDNLAEGSYHLRFLATVGQIASIDREEVQVSSGDTLDIGTIAFSSEVLDNPKLMLTAEYDTLHQNLTLRWNRLTDEYELKYTIYKRTLNPPTSWVDMGWQLDTVFRSDSHAMWYSNTGRFWTDSVFELCVEPSTQMKRGEKSDPVKITMASYLNMDTSILLDLEELGNRTLWANDVAELPDNGFVMLCANDANPYSSYLVFCDEACNISKKVQLPQRSGSTSSTMYYSLETDFSNNRLLIGSHESTHLLTCNIQTGLIDTIHLDCSDNTYLQSFFVYNDEIVTSTSHSVFDTLFNNDSMMINSSIYDSVIVFSLDGKKKHSRLNNFAGYASGLFPYKDNMLLQPTGDSLTILDMNGTVLRTFELPGIEIISCNTSSPYLYILGGNYDLRCMDENFNLLATYRSLTFNHRKLLTRKDGSCLLFRGEPAGIRVMKMRYTR